MNCKETIKVLLLEDDSDDYRLIDRQLRDQRHVFVIDWVETLAAAVEKLDRHSFDIVLTDLSVPDSRGFETVSMIKKHCGQLPLIVRHPHVSELEQFSVTRDKDGNVIYPEVDADGDHVHFEMVPMGGESLLWLTIRRGTTPKVASASLRKIADLIDRHGQRLLKLFEGKEGSFNAEGEIVSGPLRLDYDENGELVFPDHVTTDPSRVPR